LFILCPINVLWQYEIKIYKQGKSLVAKCEINFTIILFFEIFDGFSGVIVPPFVSYDAATCKSRCG